MTAKVKHLAEELRSLSSEDLSSVRALLDEMMAKAPAKQECYGEPLTDEDIAEAARVTFAALDGDESKA